MRPIAFTLAAIFSGLACSLVASASPVLSTSSARPIEISSARLERALGSGTYVTGVVEPAFGYAAGGAVNIQVVAYGQNGRLLAETSDKVNFYRLVRWHLNPRPRASYVAYFPWAASEIAKVDVVEGRR